MSDDAKRWDLIHQKTYSEERGPSHYAQEKEKLFPRGSLVVELGGGTGEDALYFAKKGHSVVVLDISEFALNMAQEKAKKLGLADKLAVNVVDFGLHKLPIKDGSVDVAFSRISLNYFGTRHTTKLFTDIHKMLKTGGTAYLAFKSANDKEEMEYLKSAAVLYEENVYIESGQLRSRFSVEQLQAMLQAAGVKKFQVAPIKEPIGGEGKRELFLNEVMFSK